VKNALFGRHFIGRRHFCFAYPKLIARRDKRRYSRSSRFNRSEKTTAPAPQSGCAPCDASNPAPALLKKADKAAERFRGNFSAQAVDKSRDRVYNYKQTKKRPYLSSKTADENARTYFSVLKSKSMYE
jgi:hypothetical protein